MIEVIILVLLIFSLIAGIVFNIYSIFKKYQKKQERKKFFNEEEYPEYIVAETNKMYEKVLSGKIRKHIVSNDSDYYDSSATMKHYKNFVHSKNMKKLVIERQDTLYNG